MSSAPEKKPRVEPSIKAVMMPMEYADRLIHSLIESQSERKLLFVDASVSGYVTQVLFSNGAVATEDTLHGKLNAMRVFENQDKEDSILKQGIVSVRENIKLMPFCSYTGADSHCVRDELEKAYRFDIHNYMHLGSLIRSVLLKSAKAVDCDRVFLFVDPSLPGYRTLDSLIVFQCDSITRVVPSGGCSPWLMNAMETACRHCVDMAEKRRASKQEAVLRVYRSVSL